MPIGDWQFWVVTAIALVALWAVVRMIVPPSLWPKRFRGKAKGKATTLTVGGKPVAPEHKPSAKP